MCKYSIIVPTYNSELSKVLLTLESILRQTFKDYEIIITDDGSCKDNFDEIERYLISRGAKKYIFIKNKTNIGTVANLQNAYLKCNGEYIKSLGPGDLLFSEDILEKLNIFLDLRNSNFAFGRLKAYYLENGQVKYHKFSAPPENIIYSYEDKAKAIKNILKEQHYISGATMIFKSDFIRQNKYKLFNVVYCEDIVQVLIALNEEKIDFFDENFIWYEYGVGISTNSCQSDKIKNDHMNFYKYLINERPKDRFIKKAYNDSMINQINNPLKRKILRLITNPMKLIYRLNTFFYKKSSYCESDGGFLKENTKPSLIYDFNKK